MIFFRDFLPNCSYISEGREFGALNFRKCLFPLMKFILGRDSEAKFCQVKLICWWLVVIMKFDQYLCKNLWYDLEVTLVSI